MKIYSLLFMAVLFSVVSCNFKEPKKDNKHAIFTDTLVYNYKTIKQRAADCGDKPDSACTLVNINYPVFNGRIPLNNILVKKITETFKINDQPDSALSLLAKHFNDTYVKEIKGSKKVLYKLNISAKVINQDSGLLAIQISGYSYQGGAHGASSTRFINWDPKIKKEVLLDDVFITGYQEKLRLVAEKIFRKEEKLTDTSTLVRDYFFKNGKFELNSNYLLTPLGIKFIYNEYEIKPYAAGQTEVVIPYIQIRNLVKPNAVIAQYIR